MGTPRLRLVQPSAPAPLKGLYTSGRKRKQSVPTPEWFLDAVCEGFRLPKIPLDPCAHPNSARHFALENWTIGGLKRPWERPAYSNPPFKDLLAWLAYARAEALRTGLMTVFLGPWRSHRIGFCAELAGAEVTWFKAFAFVGHRNKTPFPMFAATWHCSLPPTPYEVGRKHW